MIDRLRACMQEGYNSDANQIFSLLHQINNLFIMQLVSPTVQSFNVPISLSFIGMMKIIIAMTPQCEGDLSQPHPN